VITSLEQASLVQSRVLGDASGRRCRCGFTNTGTGPLHLTAIHGATAFDTEWLTAPDPVWASKPER
jgi:hypothetical protein